MKSTVKYVPLFTDDPNITQYPDKLKINPKLREKYRLARSILTDLIQDINHDIFVAMPWDKEMYREKQKAARRDLNRYHEALEQIGKSNSKNTSWDTLE